MIFFDIDGTLLDHAAAERAGALALRERHPALAAMAPDRFVERWHALAEEYVDRFLAGELSTPEQRRARLRALFVEAGSSVDDPGADTAFEGSGRRTFDIDREKLESAYAAKKQIVRLDAGLAVKQRFQVVGDSQ